jgi:redox-sensitive bicupin YhaK (pirin superfamily)
MDGAGVKLRRTIGTPALDSVDPFLLLDEFRSTEGTDYIAGFPDHPHRGFETVTYMLAGSFEHRDHLGNTGRLEPGSVQWMTAGRGIIHSEMPKQTDGLVWGFQLWVNLPASRKMCEPRYQDIPPDAVPEVILDDGVSLRVIAGPSYGATGAVNGIATEPLYVDARLPAGTRLDHPMLPGHSAFCYVYDGEGEIGGRDGKPGRTLGPGTLALLGDGSAVRAVAAGSPMRFLLVAARPIGEPVARHGPFVMNTREELVQAFRDYEAGTLQQ